jgi:hypothetical protein
MAEHQRYQKRAEAASAALTQAFETINRMVNMSAIAGAMRSSLHKDAGQLNRAGM